jgi:hypothetical protein
VAGLAAAGVGVAGGGVGVAGLAVAGGGVGVAVLYMQVLTRLRTNLCETGEVIRKEIITYN